MKTAKHLGRKWHALAKFCDTRFAQSELLVYKTFEKNYNTYRRGWSGDAEAVEPEVDAAIVAAEAAEAAAAATAAAKAVASTQSTERNRQWLRQQ